MAQLKHVEGYTPEEAKELARAYATAILVQNGFSVQAMVSPDLFNEAQIGDHVVLLRVVAEDSRKKTLCRLVQYTKAANNTKSTLNDALPLALGRRSQGTG